MKGLARFMIVVASTLLAATAAAQEASEGRRHRDSTQEDNGRPTLVADMLHRLDANGNGMVEEAEATGFQRQVLEQILRRNGIEPKFPISVNQVLQTLGVRDGGKSAPSSAAPPVVAGSGTAAKAPASGSPAVAGFGVTVVQPPVAGFGAAGRSESASSSNPKPTTGSGSTASPGKPAARKSGRFLTPKERLPQGLPDWFIQKDADGDGQISMAEFASQWTPEKAKEFEAYDLNHDGFITAAECLKVEKAKRAAPR